MRSLCAYVANLALTIIFTLAGMCIFGAISIAWNAHVNSEGFRFVWKYHFATSPESLRMYYEVRNLFISIGAAVGIVSAQAGWFSHFLDKKFKQL